MQRRLLTRLGLPRSLTIRSRLLLYFVCVLAITAAISGVTAVLESRDARQRVVAQLKSVAALKEQEVDSWIGGLDLNLDIVLSGENVPVDLHTLTHSLPGSDPYRVAYRRALQRLTWASKRMGLFEELFFMGPKGQVLLSTDRGHEQQQLGMNDYFTQGLKGRFIQEPSYSLALQEMTVVASCPVTYRGVMGVLAGRANLDSLNTLMVGRAGLGQTGETYLVASNHRLLTDLRRSSYSVPSTYIRTLGSNAAVDNNKSGFATYRGYANTTVIGVYDWIPRLKVALLAEQSEAEALRPTRLAMWATGGVGVLAAVLAILAGIILTRSIVRPLSELGETAGRIADGELDLTARVARRDEIGRLAESFNRMTSQLRGLVRSLEKRTDHLRAINQASRQISSILDLDELLPQVARSLLHSFDYETVRVLLLDEDGSGRLLSCGRDSCEEISEVRLDDLDRLPVLVSVAGSREPLLQNEPMAGAEVEGGLRSEIAVPIRLGTDLAGVLDITAVGTRALDQEDLFTAQTLADQLTVAVENARLYQHAHELAASRERQRLARDLHDAVSQTLFSVSLIAEVLPRVYEREPARGKQMLEELRQLTRGALAEMRTLLLELRPTALAEAALPDLLRQLGEAVAGRSRIPIDVRVDASPEMPSEVSVALYRIAQEALNNVAKHSGAEHASVRLRNCGDDELERGALELVVTDDGSGFDPDAVRPGSLGLGIMAERAEAIGARLQVTASLGEGTRVRVVWRPDSLPGASADESSLAAAT